MTREAEELRTRGYAVFEDYLDPAEVASLRATILEVVEELRPAQFFAKPPIELDEAAVVTRAGVVVRGLFRRRPVTVPLMMRPVLRDTLVELLGEDARLEAAGAMISDRHRPYFEWHTHIDGEDEGVRARAGVWPAVSRCERVLCLLYLEDIDPQRGPLEVLPRRIGEPTEPPGEFTERRWPGSVVLMPRAGTLVALEQCTWHAAGSLEGPGHRVVGAMYAARRDAIEPEWMDRELASGVWLSGRGAHAG